MLTLVGSIIVVASVLVGYLLSGGPLHVLFQPFEVLIIGGAAFGAFITSNSPRVVKATFANAVSILKGPQYKRENYLSILALLYELLSKARKEGLMSLEEHVDNPEASALFGQHPDVKNDHHLLEFITDCLRLMVGGNINPHELEPLLELELETHHHEALAPAHAMAKVADSLPGFGIVAAVLGIVITMGAIGGDVAEIGHHVGAALVGTFLGILLGYGFVGPLAAAVETRAHEDGKAYECVKAGLLASLRGYAPVVAVEFARKSLSQAVRPTFQELEAHLKGK
jgi:chemotaxis protein MotA